MSEWQISILIVAVILIVIVSPPVIGFAIAFFKHPGEFMASWLDKDPPLGATRIDRLDGDEIIVHTVLGHAYRGRSNRWHLCDPISWESSHIMAPEWAQKRLHQVWLIDTRMHPRG